MCCRRHLTESMETNQWRSRKKIESAAETLQVSSRRGRGQVKKILQKLSKFALIVPCFLEQDLIIHYHLLLCLCIACELLWLSKCLLNDDLLLWYWSLGTYGSSCKWS